MAASERDESLCLCVATMCLLAFSDIHRDLTQAGRLVDGGGDVDVVLAAGDFASVHRGLDELIGVLAAIETPTVVVAGNNETDVVLSEGDAGMAGQRGLALGKPDCRAGASMNHRNRAGMPSGILRQLPPGSSSAQARAHA